MKFLLLIFAILAMNNTLGMPCNKEFKDPEPKTQIGQENSNKGVLQNTTHYGIYGTFSSRDFS